MLRVIRLIALALALTTYARADALDEPPIDAVPEEFVAQRLVNSWDFTDEKTSADGWTPGPNVQIDRAAKNLKIISAQNDPYVFSPIFESAPRGRLIVKIRMRRTTTGFLQIFTSEQDYPEYDETRSARFMLPESDEFQEVRVELNVSSPLRQMRFDPGLDEGVVEIERFEIWAISVKPLKFGAFTIANGVLKGTIRNDGVEETVDLSAEDEEGNEIWSDSANVRNEATFEFVFPNVKPFEYVTIRARSSRAETSRICYSFSQEKLVDVDDSLFAIGDGKLQIRFSQDGLGACAYRSGRLVALLFPLLSPDVGSSRIRPLQIDEPREAEVDELVRSYKLKLDLSASDSRQATFRLYSGDAAIGSLRFVAEEDEIQFQVEAPFDVRCPVVKAFGERSQAIFSGVEFLEGDERSSSIQNVSAADRVRFAPDPIVRTAPFATIHTDRVSAALLSDAPKAPIYFAAPDFIDGDESVSQMSLSGRRTSGRVRFSEVAPIEDSISWFLSRRALPETPRRPRSTEAQEELYRSALLKTLKNPSGTWATAVGSGLETRGDHYASDFLSTEYELTGEIQTPPRIDVGGSYQTNFASFLLLNRADLLGAWLKGVERQVLEEQGKDGSFHYSGKYARPGEPDYASGYSAEKIYRLTEIWRLSGSQKALDGALRGLEGVNRLKTPRGAQTWELSLQAPDLLAAAYCCLCNCRAYQATKDVRYADQARRWALDGVPFVYLWQDETITPDGDPTMPYATIPTLGTTDWIAPCWIGKPVQWCGLVYARALLELAEIDDSVDWRKIAEGIVVCAERQVYPDGKYAGLLPDYFDVPSQCRNALNINPCDLNMLRRLIDGRHTNVAVVDVGDKRVVSPYPTKRVGNDLVIEGRAGTQYQLLINGSDVVSIRSQGVDVVPF